MDWWRLVKILVLYNTNLIYDIFIFCLLFLIAPLLCSRPLNTDETPRLDLCDEQQKFAEPFVRVTIRPKNPGASEIIELRNALRQLAVLDSAVRIMEQENGELAMLTAGEVHLVKCLEVIFFI